MFNSISNRGHRFRTVLQSVVFRVDGLLMDALLRNIITAFCFKGLVSTLTPLLLWTYLASWGLVLAMRRPDPRDERFPCLVFVSVVVGLKLRTPRPIH